MEGMPHTDAETAPPNAQHDELLLAAGGDRLRRLASRLLGRDADDGMQEVLTAACRSLASFRGEARMSTWFHRLAVRVLCAFRRRRDRHSEREVAEPEVAERLSPKTLLAYAATPLERLARDERRARVLAVLDRLSPPLREVLLLRGEGLAYDEIATALGVPLGTVKSRMHTALTALAERLPHAEELLP